VFFVSVASEGLRPAVSLLFATLAGKSISVAAKGVRGRAGTVGPAGEAGEHSGRKSRAKGRVIGWIATRTWDTVARFRITVKVYY